MAFTLFYTSLWTVIAWEQENVLFNWFPQTSEEYLFQSKCCRTSAKWKGIPSSLITTNNFAPAISAIQNLFHSCYWKWKLLDQTLITVLVFLSRNEFFRSLRRSCPTVQWEREEVHQQIFLHSSSPLQNTDVTSPLRTGALFIWLIPIQTLIGQNIPVKGYWTLKTSRTPVYPLSIFWRLQWPHGYKLATHPLQKLHTLTAAWHPLQQLQNPLPQIHTLQQTHTPAAGWDAHSYTSYTPLQQIYISVLLLVALSLCVGFQTHSLNTLFSLDVFIYLFMYLGGVHTRMHVEWTLVVSLLPLSAYTLEVSHRTCS